MLCIPHLGGQQWKVFLSKNRAQNRAQGPKKFPPRAPKWLKNAPPGPGGTILGHFGDQKKIEKKSKIPGRPGILDFFRFFYWSPKWPKMVSPGPGWPWGVFSGHFRAILGPPGGNFFLGPGPLFSPLGLRCGYHLRCSLHWSGAVRRCGG